VGRGYTGAMMRVFGPDERVLTVLGVEDVTPHYRRVTAHAPGMFDGTRYGAGSYLRLWFPDPDDPGTEVHRAYTIAHVDATTEQLVLEFVLHDPPGPASSWAARVQVGDQIAATRGRAPHFVQPTPAPAGYLLVADVAGLPAVNGILGEIPDDAPVDVYLEYSHDDDIGLPVVQTSGLSLRWVRTTADPAELLRAVEVKSYAGWFAWVIAESTATKVVSDQLKDWGLPRSHLKAHGYWKRGRLRPR
jgi:ATP-binding cassette, subfamily B, bacterial IrtA/YbtP